MAEKLPASSFQGNVSCAVAHSSANRELAHMHKVRVYIRYVHTCIYAHVSLGVRSLRLKASIRRTHAIHADEPPHYDTHLAYGGTLTIGIRISTNRQAISTLSLMCQLASARRLPLPRCPLLTLQWPGVYGLCLQLMHKYLRALRPIQMRLPRRRVCQ